MLRYRADLRSLGLVAIHVALVGTVLIVPTPWWMPVVVSPLACLTAFICATITHNAVHCPVFTVPILNRAFQLLLTCCYGHPVSAFVPGHNLSHHQHLQTELDLMRTHKARARSNFWNALSFGFRVGPAIFAANLDYARRMRRHRPTWYAQYRLEWGVYAAFVVGALLIDPWAFVFVVVLPHQFAAWGIMGINYAQHDGCDPDHPYNHSRNFVGPVVNWLLCNNGYHGIHHMHPSLHWSLLPDAHARELAPHVHPALDQPNLLAYLWRMAVWPGRRLCYDGEPVELPPAVPDGDWIAASAPADLVASEHLGAVAG